MIESKVIIIGGGPAGAACAWKLRQANVPVLVLDRKTFPRQKTCAGWITPRVLADLRVQPRDYPHSLLTLRRLNYHLHGIRIPVRTRQFSIRRYEFDRWLLARSGVPLVQHQARRIRKKNGRYVIDDTYRCDFLVGAGGTNCCVYRTFFKALNPRRPTDKIVALEAEFPFAERRETCHLWFFDQKLPGYAWYVPKGNGYVNVGVGARDLKLRNRGQTIGAHWNNLVRKLDRIGLVKKRPYSPKGGTYYLRGGTDVVQHGQAYIVGDAAGLATVDMGEGIGAAVRSGMLAAEAIVGGRRFTVRSVGRYSLRDVLLPKRPTISG